MADTGPALDLPKFTLRNIFIRSSNTSLAEWFDPQLPNQRLRGAFRSDTGKIKQKTLTEHRETGDKTQLFIEFSTRFEFAYLTANGDDEPHDDELDESHLAAKITAEIAVDYLVGSDTFPDEQTNKTWAESNALLHCWPYWREFCHNTMLRMNLPVMIIPLIQIGLTPEDDADANVEN